MSDDLPIWLTDPDLDRPPLPDHVMRRDGANYWTCPGCGCPDFYMGDPCCPACGWNG